MTAGTVGVLLAAGRGRRMGALKQLLPWGTSDAPKTLIAAAFDALAPACDLVVVVVKGEDHAPIAESLRPRRFALVLVEPNQEMFESIRAGIVEAQRLQPNASLLLHPADQPVINPATIDALRRKARAHPGAAVMPEFEGRGGHPVLIPAGLLDAIVAWSGGGGLRSFWENHPTLARRVPVNDAFILLDLDTQEQYERAAADVSGGSGGVSP